MISCLGLLKKGRPLELASNQAWREALVAERLTNSQRPKVPAKRPW